VFAEGMGSLSTVGKFMNASLYLSIFVDSYGLFEIPTSPYIPEEWVIALDA
jgi:hypothetical protein